jgi:hypothetical protein
MRAIPIRTREDLLNLVSQHTPSRACQTAIREDRAAVLGGFQLPDGLPCWIVQIVSPHGRFWIIAMEVDEAARCYHVQYLNQVPWGWWRGDSAGKRPLIDGDDPIRYAYKRMRAQHG